MRKATLLNAGTKGVLDPKLRDRIDLAHYYNGLAKGTNCTARPQGGFGRRPGTVLAPGLDIVESGLKRRQRRRLEPIALASGMVTVANGGTAAKLVSQALGAGNEFVTNSVSGSPFVLAELDLGAAQTVTFVDVANFYCATGRADDALAVEYYDGAEWRAFDARRNIRSMSGTQKTAVVAASVKELPLEDFTDGVVDGVTLSNGDRVLIKNQAAAKDNGIYTWASSNGDFTRATDVNASDELSKFIVFVSGGATQGQSWWSQPNDKISLGKTPILFTRVPGPERTRRFGVPPGGPGGTPVSGRYWRFVLYGANGTGAFSIGRVRLWREKRSLCDRRLFMFARSGEVRYELVLGDRNIDVFRGHRWVASVPVAVDASQVRSVTHNQSLDTLVLYHAEVETPVITRQGADDEWNAEAAIFANLPALSPSTAFSGDNDEIQRLSLSGLVTGQTFVLWVDDEVTAPVTFTGTGSLAADIATALAGLPALASTSPTVPLVDASARTLEIAFTGALGNRRWAPVLAVVLDDDVLTPETTVAQAGIDADGPLCSKATGFARCGVFNQARHVLGGFRSAPQTLATSRAGSFFDLQVTADPLTADLAFLDTLDTDQNETIHRLTVGKHLQAFTESGVWFMEARTMDATQPRNWRLAARPGIEPKVPVVFCDDATLYMQSGKKRPEDAIAPSRVLRELLLISNVESQYTAPPKNLLAPHLLTDAVDFAAGEARSTDEAAMGYVPNADGSLAHLVTQNDQEVVAFFPWVTDGAFTAVGVDVAGNVWAIVRRATEAGGADDYLERLEASTPLDAAIELSFVMPTSTVSGLGHHEGKAVWAYADGDLYGPFTVEDAAIELPVAALEVAVGLFSPWEVEPMPIREKLSNDQPFRPPGRIYEAEISLNASGPLDLAVNGGPAREVPVTFLGARQRDGGPFQAGGEMDLPLLQRLFTGSARMTNLRGFSRHPRWTLSQSKPAPVEVSAVRAELAYRG